MRRSCACSSARRAGATSTGGRIFGFNFNAPSAPSAATTWSSIRRVRARDQLWTHLCGCFDPDSMERRLLRTHAKVGGLLSAWVQAEELEAEELDPEVDGGVGSTNNDNSRGGHQKGHQNKPAGGGGGATGNNKLPPISPFTLARLEAYCDSVSSAGIEHDAASLRFLLRRIQSGDPLSRGPAAFPSTYLRLGPQFPFQPGSYHALVKRAGSLRGHELTKPIVLKGLAEEGAAGDEGGSQDAEVGEVPGGHGQVPVRATVAKKLDPWRDGIFDQDDFLTDRKRWYQY